MRMEKLLVFAWMDLVPMRRSSALSLFSLRKLLVNQDLISDRQPENEGIGGWR